MKVSEMPLPGVLLVEPAIHGDDRGHLTEVWSSRRYVEAGIAEAFVQDNMSHSVQGVLRGLHFQYDRPQGKLVSVVAGEVFDVAVDLRGGSATFGSWCGAHLSQANAHQLYIPPGFAHGFLVLSKEAVVLYKCTDYYLPGAQGVLRWDDPAVGVDWPVAPRLLSDKDRKGAGLADIPIERLSP